MCEKDGLRGSAALRGSRGSEMEQHDWMPCFVQTSMGYMSIYEGVALHPKTSQGIPRVE